MQYFFSNKSFRPFAGLGVGFYHPSITFNSSTSKGPYSTGEETSFGFYPRLGFNYSHFTLTIDYNIVENSKTLIHDNITTTAGYLENAYVGLKMGVTFGGGRKNK